MRWLIAVVGLCVVAMLAVVAGAWAFVRIPASGSRQTVVYFSIPTDLRPGARLEEAELEERLHRLGYKEADDTSETGTYRGYRGGYEIHLRPFEYPDRPFAGGLTRVFVEDGRVDRCQPVGTLLEDDCRLEPERIAGFEGQTGAVLAPLDLEDAPPLLVKTLLAVEDRRFYKHPGIDPIGTARALVADVRHRGVGQGGSTLTQQLARSLFLHNKKTVLRKAQEAVLALGLELRYSKDEILESYLNAVYWGYWGAYEIRGVREAARYYLGKDLEKIDPAGVALLIGLIQAPNAYSPYNSVEKAKKRRTTVLAVMEREGLLSAAEVARAEKVELKSKRPPERPAEASYFLDAVRKEITRRASDDWLDKPGTRIFTTLDARDQAAAETAVRQGLVDLEKRDRRFKKKREPLQAAAVVLDAETGEVRALVGGRDYQASQFNRAIDARRQPGSLFKPFVYLAAFSDPERESGPPWTPASLLEDSPFEWKSGRNVWRPRNYDREFRGFITARQALEQSINIPTARVAQEIGIDRVIDAAHDLGVTSELPEYPSLALGAAEVTLIEMTGAYSGFARNGEAVTPRLLRAIVGRDGESLDLRSVGTPPGTEAPPAFIVNQLLQGVIANGTGRAARDRGVVGAVAGKTGTTNDYKDAWFIGFSPRRVAGVWVGFDKKDVVGLSGGAAALPIWSELFRKIQPSGGDGAFPRPPGVVRVPIDPTTGDLATADCPDWMEEDFVEGTEPQRECETHGAGFFDSVRRFFRL